jgi:hypothetical protein
MSTMDERTGAGAVFEPGGVEAIAFAGAAFPVVAPQWERADLLTGAAG